MHTRMRWGVYALTTVGHLLHYTMLFGLDYFAWLQELAAASQEQVNEVWAGLGYYRRARLLLEGAQHIQANLSGKIPTTTVELQKIPGAAVSLKVFIMCCTVCMNVTYHTMVRAAAQQLLASCIPKCA